MNEISDKTLRLLTLSMLKGVGPSALRKVAASRDFERLPIMDLCRVIPALSKSIREDGAWERAVADGERQVVEAHRLQACILSPVDQGYPPLLAATKDDPFLIYVRGRLAPDPSNSVAIIGTRQPTEHGAVIAQRISGFFASERWSVVSGLALGCDALAHQAALEANGHTVAVMAHGLHTIAPAQHRKLAERILASGGALLSEYPFGRPAQPQQFVKRDRTQAGLAQGVVMIQSDVRGGSLHASRAALDYDRWLAVPYPTARDRANGEVKVQANMVIADGSSEQRQELLRCRSADLERTFVLHGKEDYSSLLGARTLAASANVGPQEASFPSLM